ncbi:MAG: LLM class flavin-dependent oxidoreductase [Proteobacteria bacterium]|nr:LLM class flavin-dependent oxidoreductase [Pseudomonadota bacterium]
MKFAPFSLMQWPEDRSQSEVFRNELEQMTLAEAQGYDSIWLAEHHFSPDRSVLASPLVIASSIATRTSRIRIGLAVQVLPLTNPLRIAEEAATVDHVSKGRFEFGIGRSGLTKYYQGYNVPYSESRQRFFARQLLATRNFGASLVLNLLLGGTNHHVEHHLFPTVSIFRLRRAREITRDYCCKRDFPYVETTLTAALGTVADSLRTSAVALRLPGSGSTARRRRRLPSRGIAPEADCS